MLCLPSWRMSFGIETHDHSLYRGGWFVRFKDAARSAILRANMGQFTSSSYLDERADFKRMVSESFIGVSFRQASRGLR